MSIGPHPGLSARDLLHGAVMLRLGATEIVSADPGFDQVALVERLDLAAMATWEPRLQP